MADTNMHAKIPMHRITKDVVMEVEVTGVRTFRWRLKVATWLIRLAAWVAGVGIRIDGDGRSDA